MADRVGVISKGELILVEEKTALMKKLGKKELTLQPRRAARPRSRPSWPTGTSTLKADGHELHLRVRRQRRADRHPVAARGG